MVNDDRESTPCVPKLCGADIELGNFILGPQHSDATCGLAARAVLREIPTSYDAPEGCCANGSPLVVRRGDAKGFDPQDWGRRYLSSNGGCAYIDLDHLELCLPEVISAYDHVATWHAMLRIARDALDAANAQLPPGHTIQVLVNNSDGQSHAYGSHLNFLISRRAWDNIFERKMHHLLYLAAYQTSSIIFTGQGKVGAENGRPAVGFQLSQRADFFETLTGVQTTQRRPIVNSRDEPLCGPWRGDTRAQRTASLDGDYARLHCIFYDNTLCHGSCLLKVGVMQIVLAMLEAERVNPRLILEDPVDAVVRWSHDPTLAARASTVSGTALTAVELQLLFLEEAQQFVAAGGCDGIVPRAADILALWEDTLVKLEDEDVTALTARLDWVLKFRILQRALQQRPRLTWASPEIKHLDHLFGSLDHKEGLYWVHEQLGVVERFVSESCVERFVHGPPEDTRAWTRAMLLRTAGRGVVHDVDWDRMAFRTLGSSYWPTVRTLHLPDPLGFTRAVVEPVIREAAGIDDILDALCVAPADKNVTTEAQRHGENGRR